MIPSPNARLIIMRILRALIAGTVLAGCLAGPVSAQGKRQGSSGPTPPSNLDKRIDEATVDKQYKATLERTKKEPVAAPADPWGGIRGGDDSKTKR
jgi:hypothetical protein